MNKGFNVQRARLIGTCASLLVVIAGAGGCDREVSKTKEESTKIVDTPEGKKKVTEKTETTTTTERKDH